MKETTMKRFSVMLLVIGVLAAACGAPAAPAPGQPSQQPATAAAPAQAVPTATAPPAATDVPATAVLGSATGNDVAQAPDQAVIVFKRGGGFAGVDEEWTIKVDGTVESKDGKVASVAPEQVAAVLAEVKAMGFFDMAEAYGQKDTCNDCFTYEVTVTMGGQTKTVSTHDAAKDAPAELGQILNAIMTLVGAM
jgi:glucose/arabinose dehydrogenase